MIKLIASDMDGTFLNPQGSYDKRRFQDLLRQLTKRNILFVVASGNRMERLRQIFAEVSDNIDYVAENGALVIDKGNLLARQTMPNHLVDAVVVFFADKLRSYRVILSGVEASYVLQGTSFELGTAAVSQDELRQFFSNLVYLEDLTKRPKDPIVKITMMVDSDDVDEVTQQFNQEFHGDLRAVSSGYGAVDIIQSSVHKAWGLQVLMAKYKIKPEEVAAFGDSGNDKELLNLAKYSFAMANATQDIKNVACYQIASNVEDAVLTTIEKILSGEIK
ncbi:putative HAD-superfamily hydrolase / phosphatase [Streptococcus gallolyticus UCN34]|uniref:HAD-superfamily hydrolase / phosphatase n=1 Tax=Streptococcus gallolyticus (strain UCN34) TaxID=637909 RepID=A0AA36NQA3_STRG3|nr:Cof-type HAD-IIB family hydrolase [Streptococcus gallolyticus]CBI13695.1 putative HAD-superfamily hydrolase / phosphatase [Streptococcus gallolyticus UCN34]